MNEPVKQQRVDELLVKGLTETVLQKGRFVVVDEKRKASKQLSESGKEKIKKAVENWIKGAPLPAEILKSNVAVPTVPEPVSPQDEFSTEIMPQTNSRQLLKTEMVRTTEVVAEEAVQEAAIDMQANQSAIQRLNAYGQKVMPRMAQQRRPQSGGVAQGAASKAAKWGMGKGIAVAMGGTTAGLGFFKFIDYLTS